MVFFYDPFTHIFSDALLQKFQAVDKIRLGLFLPIRTITTLLRVEWFRCAGGTKLTEGTN